jgi:hypothetical protein
MPPSVRLYVKKQLRLDRLNCDQRLMYEIGTLGVETVKRRIAAAQGPTDAPAKPLCKLYAITKTKAGKGNRRNLSFTGNMMRAFTLRTVSDNSAKASFSTMKERIKGWNNQKIEEWAVFSPRNAAAIVKDAQNIVNQRLLPHLLVQRIFSEHSAGSQSLF